MSTPLISRAVRQRMNEWYGMSVNASVSHVAGAGFHRGEHFFISIKRRYAVAPGERERQNQGKHRHGSS